TYSISPERGIQRYKIVPRLLYPVEVKICHVHFVCKGGDIGLSVSHVVVADSASNIAQILVVRNKYGSREILGVQEIRICVCCMRSGEYIYCVGSGIVCWRCCAARPGDLCLILYICYSQPCTVERYCRRCLSCVRAVTCRIVNDRINLTTEIGCVDIVCQYICGNVIYRKRGSVLTQRMPPSPAEAVSVVSKSGRRIYI